MWASTEAALAAAAEDDGMTHRLHHGLAFLAALAAGGGVAAALIGIGIAEVAAIVCGWAVFLILGTALGTAVTHRHRHS